MLFMAIASPQKPYLPNKGIRLHCRYGGLSYQGINLHQAGDGFGSESFRAQ